MRGTGLGLLLLAVCQAGMLGCATPDKHKPPPAPEELLEPPSKEARFIQPIKYPKEAMDGRGKNAIVPAAAKKKIGDPLSNGNPNGL